MKTCRAILIAAAATLVLAALPATSLANDLFTLDTNAQSNGHLIEDAAGNAYVAWVTEGVGTGIEPVKYCKIAPGGTCGTPKTLSIPGATSISESASAAFPVFGPGNTVYVVAPRYAKNDVVFWTSNDGGANFDAGTQSDPYSSKTNPTDVFLVGGNFLVSAYNSGLGFSTNTVPPPGGGEFEFKNPGSGGVAGASMGLFESKPVIAYWNISDPLYQLFFYRYNAGLLTTEASWEGPFEVTQGYEPSLSTGPDGLLMVSEDYGGGPYPNTINFRRYNGASFGAPLRLAVDSDPDLFVGGDIAQSPKGDRIVAVWPGTRDGDGAFVMRLFTSTDNGAHFTESHVARLGSSYAIGPNAEVATNDSGSGWVLFEDSNGLRLADLNPIAGPPSSPPPATPTPPKTTPKAPKPYSGPTKEITKQVGDFLIVLRLPKSCLQSRQKFFVGVGKRKRKQLEKKLGGEIHFTKVVFIYDGKKLKVKKQKPFRYLVDPGPLAPGSVHKVKAKVTLVLEKGNQEKKIKRLIKGTVKAC